MAIAQNICFAATCGLVVLGADYGQSSRRAQIPFGQMGVAQYGAVLSNRFQAIEGVPTINLTAIADLTTSWSLVSAEEPIDPTIPQVMTNPDLREDRIGVRVNKGLARPTSRASAGGCVRRGTILNC
ncbi:hypothetical protein FEE96_13745 [Parasedimentitalea maritima]|uniref:Uncharacterized protein n=1 Tax=Parasedimentitalea maritima TaxID=2578117 RepID=A0ABY2UZL0_9RHOB|nr:hypothetical protein [Zongyanglinia marina]TLP62792.1 hypothetical protein FEE96_13745 [Zongyanglinia marina]